jgi:hypothetical protein
MSVSYRDTKGGIVDCECGFGIRYAVVVVCQSRKAAAGLELMCFITETKVK